MWREMENGSIRGGGPCALCGVNPSWGLASITTWHDPPGGEDPTIYLCHEDGHRDCYFEWTMLGMRPPG